MNHQKYFTRYSPAIGAGILAMVALGQIAPAAEPYKIVTSSQTMGTGGIDYVYADNDGGRIYVPRGNQILAFDLETLKPAGTIADAGGHGVAVDPKTHHGFSSSKPVCMFDTQSLAMIKKIDVQGRPDGILFEPLTSRVYVFSHSQPNATVLDPADGSIAGTIDLGGSPEQAASDENGHLYVDLEDKDSIAVVDVKTLKVTAHYDLAGKGGGPGGLGLDAKNHILFAMCHEPAVCVILSADDGHIITTLPINSGCDGGGFNPKTMEAFSSQRDGTLTIIKENSPTSFEVEQTVETKRGGKTCTLDTKNNRIIVIAVEPVPAPAGSEPAAASAPPPASGGQPGEGRPRRGGRGGPGLLDVLAIGR